MIFSQTVLFLGYKENEKGDNKYCSVNFLNAGGGYETTNFIGDVSTLENLKKYDNCDAIFSVRSVDNSKENYFTKKLDCVSLVK